jgi:hypothetical protein
MISGTSAKKSGIMFFKKALLFRPVSLFVSMWGPNKLSPQVLARMLMENHS